MMYVQLPKGVYDVQPGMFGLIRYTRTNWEGFKPVYVEWYHCRDSFQYAWSRHTKHAWRDDALFFVCKKKRLEAFLNCAEKALGLWRKTKVYHTHVRGIVGIHPAPFWNKQEMRMSLFTILLRAAEHYRIGTDWRECLFNNQYAQETKEAVEYFFKGHVIYRGEVQPVGWCYAFSPMYQKDHLENLLKRPKLSSIGRWFKGWFIDL